MSTVMPPVRARGPAPDAPLLTALAEQLEPVRVALLDAAHAQADQILHDARTAAERLVDQASADAAAQVERERRRGELVGEAEADAQLARAANEARSRVLGRRLATRDELIRRVRDAALRLRDDADYPKMLDRLAAMATAQLGTGAEIRRDPEEVGGVIGVADGRRVDYTLPALADRAVAAIADEAVTLWA